MRFAFLDHHGKGAAYLRELTLHHRRVEVSGSEAPAVDFVFTDSDIRRRRPQLEALRERGARWFFVYPHTAPPNLVNDIDPAWEHTSAHFVTTRAQREIMLRYGYPRPLHAVGWSLCEQREFQKRAQLQNILFAPIHHRSAEIDQLANREAFARLAQLAQAGQIDLTVRHYMGLETTGIEPVKHANIHYVKCGLEPETQALDAADVVVGHQTFLYLAVARGVPAVAFGTWIPTHIVPGNEVLYARNWHTYAGDLAYPLDIVMGDPLDLLWTAVEGDARVTDWRRRMIGEPFDRDAFQKALEGYLK